MKEYDLSFKRLHKCAAHKEAVKLYQPKAPAPANNAASTMQPPAPPRAAALSAPTPLPPLVPLLQINECGTLGAANGAGLGHGPV